MFIRFGKDRRAVLEAQDDFSTFKILVDRNVREKLTVADYMQFGRLDEDGLHAWVDSAWLRANATTADGWEAGFQKMLVYATTKGWLDSQGKIRAHIEFLA